MKVSSIFLVLVFPFLFSCSEKQNVQSLLTADSLTAQTFEIPLNKDTVLKTSGGAILTIKKGTFISSLQKSISLVIKEAYTPEAMLKAGLTTKSKEGPLSSGGMIYISAKNQSDYSITKKIKVAIPTSTINPNMSVYKGKIQKDGSIEWQKDTKQTIAKDTSDIRGQTLFENNCAACHALGKIKVGPDLAYIGKRRPKEWLHAFTRNSSKLIKSGSGNDSVSSIDSYAICLYQHYNYTEMTSFPYSDKELAQLYTFIDNYSFQNNLPLPIDKLYHCADSCFVYSQRLAEMEARLEKAKANKTIQNKWNNSGSSNIPVPSPNLGTSTTPSVTAQSKQVTPSDYTPEYYEIEVNTFGWNNIDILLKNLPNIEDCILQVTINGLNEPSKLYLVLPEYNMLADGGLMKDKKTYSFYLQDGTIPLPIGRKAHIILLREDGDKFWYQRYSFIIQKQETVHLEPSLQNADSIMKDIRSLNIKDFKLEIKESLSAKQIRLLENELKNVELLKPKNCDCTCGEILDSEK